MSRYILRTDAGERDPYEELRRVSKDGNGEVLSAWTVPAAASRGDLVVLYGKKPVQEVGFVGVVLCDSQRSGHDGYHWSEVRWREVDRPLTLDEMREHSVLGRWDRAPRQGSHETIADGSVWDSLIDLLLVSDGDAARDVDAWEDGVIPDAEGIDLSEMAYRPRSRLPREKEIEQNAARALIRRLRQPRLRWLNTEDQLPLSSKFRLLLDPANRPDLTLARASGKELFLIEVKPDPAPGKRTDGISQLERYLPRAKSQAPGWTVTPVLLAVNLPRFVETDPRVNELGIQIWRFDPSARLPHRKLQIRQ